MRRAASRAACTAGSKRAMSTAMIAMTTRSSISVKAGRLIVGLMGEHRGLIDRIDLL
jgi:hypothetical protein